MGTHRRFFFFLVVALALVLPPGIASGAPGTTDLDSEIIGLFDEGFNDRVVLVDDGIAYVGGLAGLAIYNVTSPASPQGLSALDGWVEGLAKEGDHLYAQLGGDEEEIAILDVADPANPIAVAHILPPAVPGSPPTDYPQLEFEGPLQVRNGYLYAPSTHQWNPWTFYRALNIYDVRTPAVPVLVGQTALRRDTSANDVLLQGSYLYVADNLYLETVNVANPVAPSLVSPSIETLSNALAADGSLLYSCEGAGSGEISVYSLGDPARPRYEGPILGPADILSCIDMELTHPRSGQSILVAGWQADSFKWLEVYDVTPPIRLGAQSLLMDLGEIEGLGSGSINDIELDGRYVYISQWDQGVRVAEVDYSSATATAPVLTKYPPDDRVVLKRRAGVVKWKFALFVDTPGGDPVSGQDVKVQRSLNGRTWKTLGTFPTDSDGFVGVRITFKAAGTTWWRWVSPAQGSWLAAKTAKTKVVVK